MNESSLAFGLPDRCRQLAQEFVSSSSAEIPPVPQLGMISFAFGLGSFVGKETTKSALDEDSALPVPAGLQAHTIQLSNDEYVILSFPIPTWRVPESLTAAEREVTLAVLNGASSRAIAGARGTSVRTVANQIASIFNKLGVMSRIELAVALGQPVRTGGEEA